jgi:hypothetical protein
MGGRFSYIPIPESFLSILLRPFRKGWPGLPLWVAFHNFKLWIIQAHRRQVFIFNNNHLNS